LLHNNKYDYCKTVYNGKRDKVIIICPIHGEFTQTAGHHMRGQGCPECGKEKSQKHIGDYQNARKTTISFRNDIHTIFGDKYEVIGNYINNKTKIEIFCKEKYKDGTEHGSFFVRPDDLIQQHGCPKCTVNKSYVETELIKFIQDKYDGQVISGFREFDGQKEIDIYLPDRKIGFEYNGLLWHSTKYKRNHSMLDKLQIAENCGIKLINIFEDEWLWKREICESRILNIIGLSEKIYARMCNIQEVGYKDAKAFLEKNHIQGAVSSKYNIALFYQDEMVALMTFGALRKNLGQVNKPGYFELLRFCCKLNTSIIGGASRLFKYFIKKYSPIEIISYADRRWSQGDLYEKLGFQFVSNTKPNYSYIDGKQQMRINRYTLRKNVLVEKYNCPHDVSETKFCHSIGLYQVFDCGNKKYIWKQDK
jgi:predicted  nucleic acid-binding Zn-ribbon protein